MAQLTQSVAFCVVCSLYALAGCGKPPTTVKPIVVTAAPSISSTQQITSTPALPNLNLDAENLQAHEVWRMDLGRTSPRRIAVLPRRGYALTLSFSDQVHIGARSFSSTGEDDALIVGIAETGKIEWATPLGGSGDEEIQDQVVSTNSIHVAIRTDGPLALAGRTVAPRARRPGDILDNPMITTLVTLSASGQPAGNQVIPDEPREVALGAFENGDLLVAASFSGKSVMFGHAVVRRVNSRGEDLWTQRFSGLEVHRVLTWPNGCGLSVRADERLGVWIMNPATGVVTRKAELTKTPSAGDLGTIAGAALNTDGMLIGFGETGDDVLVDGRAVARPSYAIQPFAMRTATDGTVQFIDGPDVTGRIIAVGDIRGRPAAVLQVIHTGKVSPDLHRGVYIGFLAATGMKLVPIFQQRYRNDDWEHEPAETVRGQPFMPHSAAFSGHGVTILGRCEPNGRTTCVMRIELNDGS